MNATIARLRAHAATEEGLSITELIVSIMVTGIVLTIVGSMFVNVVHVTSDSNATTTRTSTAANIMNEISTVIRPAVNNPVSGANPDPAVVSGTPLSLTLYSLVDTNPGAPQPSKVSFAIDASGKVVESRWTASNSGGFWVFTGSSTVRSFDGPVLSQTGTNALFVYLDSTGTVITPGASGLTLAQRNSVTAIQVTVSIANNPTPGSDPVTIINTFGMPNVIKTGTAN